MISSIGEILIKGIYSTTIPSPFRYIIPRDKLPTRIRSRITI